MKCTLFTDQSVVTYHSSIERCHVDSGILVKENHTRVPSFGFVSSHWLLSPMHPLPLHQPQPTQIVITMGK
jgi:hypothetical protein